ncbi:MAG: ParB/RepB/Spo0J family partition protein [Armatimonadota bacterium]|nr:ParB/RepB/Spo0J family partition protein [Fimbriimonadaceae bacterium]
MSALEYLQPTELVLAPYNPRRTASDESLRELAESIRKQGLLQPVLVREVAGQLEVVCGSRRTRAAIIAGADRIPAIVKEMSDQEAIEAALTENIQRTDVEPIEEVEAIEGLSRFYGTDQAIADRLGRSADWVSRRRKLLGLTGSLQESLRAKEFPLGWYEIACRLPEADQNKVLEYARGWSGPETPAKLRSYLNSQAVLLHTAKFDISEPMGDRPSCHGCQHNTASQTDLFGGDEPPRCQNRTCFDHKQAMFAERFAEENQLPLIQVDWSKPTIRGEHYDPERSPGYTKVVAGAGSAHYVVGEVFYVKLPGANGEDGADPKAAQRREYLAACKKENFIRFELLLELAGEIREFGEVDVEKCFEALDYILWRVSTPAGPRIQDKRSMSLPEFLGVANAREYEPGCTEPENRRALLAFLVWRACHEELACKDWPMAGREIQPDTAIQEAYYALSGDGAYLDARGRAEQLWADLPQNRKKEGAA